MFETHSFSTEQLKNILIRKAEFYHSELIKKKETIKANEVLDSLIILKLTQDDTEVISAANNINRIASEFARQ
jgi:septum formation inhibitor-activating ATPase MinD